MPDAEDVPETARDLVVTDLLARVATGLYWIFWPIGISVYYCLYYAVFAALFILKLLYRPLEFILLPVFYLLRFVLDCLLAPFYFLAKFETLYIYLGSAAMIGIGLGLVTKLIYDSLRKPLGLDESSQPPRRTARQYRTEKRKRKAKAEAPLITAGYLSPSHLGMSDGAHRGRNKGLQSQTIMEEMDSDY